LRRPDAQEREHLGGGEERIRHGPPVAERQGGGGLAGHEREENLSLELGCFVERREPADEVSLVRVNEP
jgi:hypothetical protein